jgi:flagellar FliL protein
MAKEQDPQQQGGEPQPSAPAASFPVKKLVLLGIPLFLLQLGLAYVVTVKVIVPSHPVEAAATEQDTTQNELTGGEEEQPLFHLKEVLVNPAGTNGTRFLLTSVGFQVSSLQAKQELERKEVQLRDVMNSILTRKTLPELIDYQKREEMRKEIMQEVSGLLKSGTIKEVYFSKFIVQ